jgi:hypothetical protein
MEIKYHMPKGGGLIYSWTATGIVSYELHGEPDKNPPGATIGYFESYDLDDKVGKKSKPRHVHRTQHWDSRMVLGEQD